MTDQSPLKGWRSNGWVNSSNRAPYKYQIGGYLFSYRDIRDVPVQHKVLLYASYGDQWKYLLDKTRQTGYPLLIIV